ncbi:MAG: hypothetical protein VB085_08850 [Peptococcaceae bacterium]|nr:hypothetical protein [Peptococcaceae bacterium]
MANMYIREKVQPGETRIIRRPFQGDGRFTFLTCRFYGGQMLDLELDARVQRYGRVMVDCVSAAGGSTIIAGDDDTLKFSVGIDIRRGEVLEITLHNKTTVPVGDTASDYAYDCQLIADILEVADYGY